MLIPILRRPEVRVPILKGRLTKFPFGHRLKLHGDIPTRLGLAKIMADKGNISLPGRHISWSKSIIIR